MENQMKVCFITLDQYNRIWAKLQPQERFVVEMPTLGLMHRKANALLIVGKQEDFIADVKTVIRPDWLA